MPDEWGTTQEGQTRPRVVKRGIDDDHDEVPDGTYVPPVPLLLCNDKGISKTWETVFMFVWFRYIKNLLPNCFEIEIQCCSVVPTMEPMQL